MQHFVQCQWWRAMNTVTRLRRKPWLSGRGGMRDGCPLKPWRRRAASADSAEALMGATAVKSWGSTCPRGTRSNWRSTFALWVLGWVWLPLSLGGIDIAKAEDVPEPQARAAIETVQRYAMAVASGDPLASSQRDFVCLLKMAQEGSSSAETFAPASGPIYPWCWNRLEQAHAGVIENQDRGLDEIWPGKGTLVKFSDFRRFLIAETDARQFVPSIFVMERLVSSPTGSGITLGPIETALLPHASFRVHDDDPVVAVPTTLVRLRVQYNNPITAPVANAHGSEDWVVPYKKPQGVVKAVTVNWVVLSDLKRLGFPTDTAVLNIPLDGPMGTIIPFVIESGGYRPDSTEWWEADDALAALHEAVQQVKTLPDRRERIALLNRILIIHPHHQEALEVLAHELYEGLLAYGSRLHGIQLTSAYLAQRFNELYWTVQSQTDRMDLALDMAMGGKAEPTPADYLYRVIPIMEAVAALQIGDFENRLRLSLAYRWTNDQMAAITTPQQLLAEIPPEQPELRARVLLELAWSRISKVAWNRHFDDPDIVKGYQEAEEAFTLTNNPLDKFTAVYAMAYSLAFTPNRDNQAMLQLLTEARRWYNQLPGSTQQSWAYLLHNDTLKGLVETDPSFQALLAAAHFSPD